MTTLPANSPMIIGPYFSTSDVSWLVESEPVEEDERWPWMAAVLFVLNSGSDVMSVNAVCGSTAGGRLRKALVRDWKKSAHASFGSVVESSCTKGPSPAVFPPLP